MLQNPSQRRHHSKWVLPSLRQSLCAVVGLTGNMKPMASSEANGESEWQVSTHQLQRRSRCWSPGLSHLTTYGADGECWSLTWTDLPWCGQICAKKPQNIFIWPPLAHRSCHVSQHFLYISPTTTTPNNTHKSVWQPRINLFYSRICV